MSNEIKPKAICVFRNNGEILVTEYSNPETNEIYYRPVGGRIEFGENSKKALQREIQEELGTEIENIRFLGVLENIYEKQQKPKHEIFFVYDADFIDTSLYYQEFIEGYEITSDEKIPNFWKPISSFLDGSNILFPSGILDLLVEDMLVEITEIEEVIPLKNGMTITHK